MTTTVQSTSVNTSSGINPFAASGDSYVLLQGATIVDTDLGTGLLATTNGNIYINGDIVSPHNYCVEIFSTASAQSIVQLSASSHLSGNVGVAVFGGYLITAAGSIIGDFGIDGSSHGSIINTGVISGYVYGVIQEGSVAGDSNTFINSGSVTGLNCSYISTNGNDSVTNSGTMTGNVSTGGGNDALYNFGHVYGNVDMGSGNDTVYTDLSQLGPYTLQGGAGSDTLVNIENNHTASVNLANIGFETYYGGAIVPLAEGRISAGAEVTR